MKDNPSKVLAIDRNDHIGAREIGANRIVPGKKRLRVLRTRYILSVESPQLHGTGQGKPVSGKRPS